MVSPTCISPTIAEEIPSLDVKETMKRSSSQEFEKCTKKLKEASSPGRAHKKTLELHDVSIPRPFSPARTAEEDKTHRSEIAKILQEASEVALTVDDILQQQQPSLPEPPPGPRRYQRRNSFVVHRDGVFGGALRRAQSTGDKADPSAPDRVGLPAPISPAWRKSLTDSPMRPTGTVLGLSKEESSELFRQMRVPRADDPHT